MKQSETETYHFCSLKKLKENFSHNGRFLKQNRNRSIRSKIMRGLTHLYKRKLKGIKIYNFFSLEVGRKFFANRFEK